MNKTLTIDQQITFLYTSDLVTTAQFYENILGFKLVLDQGACRIYHTTSNSFLGFCEQSGKDFDSGNVIFTLVTSDVDDWFEMLREKGVVFEKPPVFNPQYQIYHCFLRDPNGYLIEIQRFEDPRWKAENSIV
jgi:catechol 2,3-dioxygenase-like lactoylglutathione lyase family enzyme